MFMKKMKNMKYKIGVIMDANSKKRFLGHHTSRFYFLPKKLLLDAFFVGRLIFCCCKNVKHRRNL